MLSLLPADVLGFVSTRRADHSFNALAFSRGGRRGVASSLTSPSRALNTEDLAKINPIQAYQILTNTIAALRVPLSRPKD